MLYRISVAERGLTDIANIFRSCLSRLDDPLRAGTVPLILCPNFPIKNGVSTCINNFYVCTSVKETENGPLRGDTENSDTHGYV